MPQKGYTMAKAKKRDKASEMQRLFGEFAQQHNRKHDADHLLDELEQNAKRVIASKSDRQDENAAKARTNARAVLAYAEQARAGNVAAAIQAERHHWRMEWHARGTTDALVVAAQHVVRWRGTVINCGERVQHKRMLELIGDADRVDLAGFMRDAGFSSVATLRKAFTDLNKHLDGWRFTVSDRRSAIIVSRIT
jgi:ElaB/YqjD/DUF883 family membrane-anchored ribosome-binding protein